MGLKEWLKGLFSKDDLPSNKKESLKLDEAVDFLKKYSDEGKIFEKIGNKDEEIKKKVTEIREMLGGLENATVPRNIKESPAIETKVFGNRGAYISYVNILLKKLEFRAEDYEKAFDEFSEKSIKSFYATQYLFGKELKEVAQAIQNLSRLFLEKKDLQKELSDNKFKKIEEQIKLLSDTLKTKSVIKSEIGILEKELKRIEPLSTERKYIELRNSEAYGEALKKREETEQLSRKTKEEVVEFFSGIKRILKKANNKKRMWIVNYYIDEPIEALLEDKELKIMNFIEAINKDDVDEDLTPVKRITREKIMQLRTRYESALESMKKAEKKSDVENQVFEFENSIFRLNSQKTVLQKKLNELKKRDEVNVDELKKDIENKLTEISGSLVEIQI